MRGMEFPPWPCVYAIATGKSWVKIGHTTDMGRRFAQLQTGSPRPLRVLATMPGGQAEERFLHREFARYRQEGEWFLLYAASQRRLLELMASDAPGRIEPKRPPARLKQPRSRKVKRYWYVSPETYKAAVDHLNEHWNNPDAVIRDPQAMRQLETNIAREWKRDAQKAQA